MIVVTGMRWTCVGGVSFMCPLPSPLLPQDPSDREAVKEDITKVCESMSACSEEHVTYRPYVNDVTCYILWMLCHQLRPSWVAKSNGELYSVTCRLPLFVGTHEPSFIVTLNAQGVNMACFWLKPLSLRTCMFPESYELTNHTAIPFILPLKMATQYPQFQFTVHCPFTSSTITAWGLSPVHSCLPHTQWKQLTEQEKKKVGTILTV